MRISDWSSDVCSSDLTRRTVVAHGLLPESDPGEHALHEAVALREAVKHVHHFAVEQAEVADIAGDRLGGDAAVDAVEGSGGPRSEEHTSELQSLMRISYAVFCLKKKKKRTTYRISHHINKRDRLTN